MVTIFYESHATSVDNVARHASGHDDVPLHQTGQAQARKMGVRYAATEIDAIFCSDLQRSYRTAEIAFSGRAIPIIKDRRLRELDYGDWTGVPMETVLAARDQRVTIPFPSGESYAHAAARMRAFLTDLLRTYDGKTVILIGHRATHYGLEYWINQVPLEEVVNERRAWTPGQVYTLQSI